MTKGRVYFDTNLIIYLVEGHPDFEDSVLSLIDEVEAKGGEIIISDLTMCECLMAPTKKGIEALIEQYNQFFDSALKSSPFTLIHFDPAALEMVPEVAAQCGLKILDATHLSLALQAGCDAFATNDKGFAAAEDLIDVLRLS